MNGCCKGGFTIIEWLTSFFATLVILTVVFQFSAQMYARLLQNAKHNARFTEVSVALDTMSKQIAQAPGPKSRWKKISKNLLVWHDEDANMDIGYFYEKKKLFFVTGSYVGDDWKRKRKNIIANHLEKCELSVVIDHAMVTSVRCRVTFLGKKKPRTLERVMLVKNRVIS